MTDKLITALRARIPIVSATTTDPIHAREVLEFLLEGPVVPTPALDVDSQLKKLTSRYVLTHGFESSIEHAYLGLQQRERTAILINTDLESPLIYDTGTLPVPRQKLRQLLTERVEDPEAFLALTGGLTLRDTRDLLAMTAARDKALTPRGFSLSRQQYMPRTRGIEPVSTTLPYYLPNPDLDEWLDLNRPFFLDAEVDERLIPRGLLLAGEPGVGKTLGAKHLAAELGVPLYRLDVPGLMSKWLGDAESNLRRALAQAEQESPCVLLMDEIEKAFAGAGKDHETTGRILGYLLWWLQEHESRVLSVMTTNDMQALPTELYRPGRIDSFLVLTGLGLDEAGDMAGSLLKTFHLEPLLHTAAWSKAFERLKDLDAEHSDGIAHAQVTQAVFHAVKSLSQAI